MLRRCQSVRDRRASRMRVIDRQRLKVTRDHRLGNSWPPMRYWTGLCRHSGWARRASRARRARQQPTRFKRRISSRLRHHLFQNCAGSFTSSPRLRLCRNMTICASGMWSVKNRVGIRIHSPLYGLGPQQVFKAWAIGRRGRLAGGGLAVAEPAFEGVCSSQPAFQA